MGIALFNSCSLFNKSDKKVVPIELVHAFIQREIPGQQDATIRNYLSIEVSIPMNQKVLFKKVQYDNKIYELDNENLSWKIDLSKNINTGERLSHHADIKHAVLIFQDENNKIQQFVISNIEQKEDLYLP